jgi:hypothetical protein
MAAADAILQRLVLGNRAGEGHRVVIGAPSFGIVLCLMEEVVWEERVLMAEAIVFTTTSFMYS